MAPPPTRQHALLPTPGTAGAAAAAACMAAFAGTAWMISQRHGSGLLDTLILTTVFAMHLAAGGLSLMGRAQAAGRTAMATWCLKVACWTMLLFWRRPGEVPPGWVAMHTHDSVYLSAGCGAYLDYYQLKASGQLGPALLLAMHMLQSLLLAGMVEMAKHQAQLPSRGWAWSCVCMMACVIAGPRVVDALMRRWLRLWASVRPHASLDTTATAQPVSAAADMDAASKGPHKPRSSAAQLLVHGSPRPAGCGELEAVGPDQVSSSDKSGAGVLGSASRLAVGNSAPPCACSGPVCACKPKAPPAPAGAGAAAAFLPASFLQAHPPAMDHTQAVFNAARSAVERMRVQPYSSRLGAKSKVCIKLDSHASVSELPDDLVPQLRAALAGIGYPRHHMLDVAARQGCIAISMELIDEVLEGVAADAMTHGPQDLPARMALAVAPVLAPLMAQRRTSGDAHDSSHVRGMTVVLDGAAARLLWDDSSSCWVGEPLPGPAAAAAPAGGLATPAASALQVPEHADAEVVVALGSPASIKEWAGDMVLSAVQVLQPQAATMPPAPAAGSASYAGSAHSDAERQDVTASGLERGDILLHARVTLLATLPCSKAEGEEEEEHGWAPAAVAGWQPPSPGQHAGPSALEPAGTQLRLLARCQGSYLPTRVQQKGDVATSPVWLSAAHGASGCAVLAEVEVEVQVGWELLPRHHAGGPPLGVLPVVLELWRGELHCVSCAPLLLQLPAMQATQAQPWWWGANSRAVRQALQQLQDVAAAQEVAAQQGVAGVSDALEHWHAFMGDLVAWFVHMPAVATLCGRCHSHASSVHGVRMPQPALAPPQLQELGQGMSAYAEQVQLRHVLRMLRQQQGIADAATARASAAPSAHARGVAPSLHSQVVARARLLWTSMWGDACPACEARCRAAMSTQLAGVQVYSSLAFALIGVMGVLRTLLDRGSLVALLIWLPWTSAHLLLLARERYKQQGSKAPASSSASGSASAGPSTACTPQPAASTAPKPAAPKLSNAAKGAVQPPQGQVPAGPCGTPAAAHCRWLCVVAYVIRTTVQLMMGWGVLPVNEFYRWLLHYRIMLMSAVMMSLGEQMQASVLLPAPVAMGLAVVEWVSNLLVAGRHAAATWPLACGLLVTLLLPRLALDMHLRTIVMQGWSGRQPGPAAAARAGSMAGRHAAGHASSKHVKHD